METVRHGASLVSLSPCLSSLSKHFHSVLHFSLHLVSCGHLLLIPAALWFLKVALVLCWTTLPSPHSPVCITFLLLAKLHHLLAPAMNCGAFFNCVQLLVFFCCICLHSSPTTSHSKMPSVASGFLSEIFSYLPTLVSVCPCQLICTILHMAVPDGFSAFFPPSCSLLSTVQAVVLCDLRIFASAV